MTSLKIKSTLTLNPNFVGLDDTKTTVAEEVNLINLPETMSDENIKQFFENYKEGMKNRYIEQLKSLFDVKLETL